MAPDIRRNLLTGTVTVIPILVTIFILSFVMNLLSEIGRPKLIVLANAVKPLSPELGRWLLEVPWLSSTLAIALTVLMLYLLGWFMHRLVGRQSPAFHRGTARAYPLGDDRLRVHQEAGGGIPGRQLGGPRRWC
jgi:uncharacterized membrane protein